MHKRDKRITARRAALLWAYLRDQALASAPTPSPRQMCDALGLTLDELKAGMAALNRSGMTVTHKAGEHVVIELPSEGLVLSPFPQPAPEPVPDSVPESVRMRAYVKGPGLFEKLQARFGHDADAECYEAVLAGAGL